jgi:PPP family 3-phenylpropionic acid transporter
LQLALKLRNGALVMEQLGAWFGRAGVQIQRQERGMWAAKLYYFSFFAAIGAIAPFFNIFLQQRGLSGTEIGVLGSLAPLVSLVANPFWGAVADRFQIHQVVLAFCVLMAGVLSVPFIWLNGFLPILLLLLVMIFFRTPVPALLDTAVMGMIAHNGASYGRQRLFGSIGFLLTSYGLGQVMAADDLDLIFWVHGALLAVGCMLLSFLLPFHKHTDEHGASMLAGLRLLAGQRRYVTFLIMNVFVGFGSACFINFVGLRLLSLGGDSAQVGLAFALNAVTEIPVMFMGARLTAQFGTSKVLIAGVFGLAAAYIFAGLASTPTLVLVAMAMVGFFSGAFWMNVVIYANESAPPQLRATGQSLVGAAQAGVGWALGGITGGILWDAFGGTAVLLAGGISLIIGAFVFIVGQRPTQPARPVEVTA